MAEDEEDVGRQFTTQLALGFAEDAMQDVRGTQHKRMMGKVLLCAATCRASLGDFEKAREWLREAETLLHPAVNDYMQVELDRLRLLLTGGYRAEGELKELVEAASRGKYRLRDLNSEFTKIIVRLVWRQVGTVVGVAKRFGINRRRAAKLLVEAGLSHNRHV
jgi:hypothetical protein